MAGSRREGGYPGRWLYASQTDKDLDRDLAAVEDRLDALDSGGAGASIPYNPTAEQIAALPAGGYYVTGP